MKKKNREFSITDEELMVAKGELAAAKKAIWLREEMKKKQLDIEGRKQYGDYVRQPDRKPYCCPVCNGRGSVLGGFYGLGSTTNITSPEECKTCKGTGVIWRNK